MFLICAGALILGAWSCAVPDFVFNGVASATTSDQAASATERGAVTANAASSGGVGGNGGNSSGTDATTSSASTSSSGGASSSSSSATTGGAEVPCYQSTCGPGEVCCVNGDKAGTSHQCKATKGDCNYTALACHLDSDCNPGEVCCAQFGNQAWPDSTFCTAQCSAPGLFRTCESNADCSGSTCQPLFCRCNDLDVCCFCNLGQCSHCASLQCFQTPYNACF